jgi:hypothetical protein
MALAGGSSTGGGKGGRWFAGRLKTSTPNDFLHPVQTPLAVPHNTPVVFDVPDAVGWNGQAAPTNLGDVLADGVKGGKR